MILTIHRGAHQIGGCATELRTERSRILIDLGSQLPGRDGTVPEDALEIPGVTRGEPDCNGVFFTHSHADHIGEMGRILPRIPLYIGPAAREIQLILNRRLNASPRFDRSRELAALERAKTYVYAEPVTAGDICVTPIYTDHSAFDAAMLLIEADGLRILHTGDFRIHGPKRKGVLPALQKYVGTVDYLICEGTMLSRMDEPPVTEWELQQRAGAWMERYKRVFVLSSSTNIDSIMAFCHARPDHRPVLCDRYQKEVLETVEKYGHSGFYQCPRPLYTLRQGQENPKLDRYVRDKGALIFIRANELSRELLARYGGEDSLILYSMWEGYLKEPFRNEALTSLLEGRRWESLHTGGHATAEELRALVETVTPRHGIIPIHTEAPKAFQALFPDHKVILPKEGERVALGCSTH